jgi:predicted anti-sigma-YlaC factor YlaD
MSSCQEIRELLSQHLEAELSQAAADRVAEHLSACDDCAETFEAMQLVSDVVAPLANLEPPPHLHDELVSSPCRLWLGMLFKAVDREISEPSLARLLSHMEGCEGCRRTWNDLTLIHQVSTGIEPPRHLLESCIQVRQKRRRRRIIGRKTAVAAAYLLAVLIGPPVTLARHQAVDAVQMVADTVSNEVAEIAETSRGEARVMLWRTWQWGQRQAETVRELLDTMIPEDDSDPEQGGTDDQHEKY